MFADFRIVYGLCIMLLALKNRINEENSGC